MVTAWWRVSFDSSLAWQILIYCLGVVCALVSQLTGEVLPRAEMCGLGPMHVKALLVPKHPITEYEGSALRCRRLHQSASEGALS